MTMSKAAFRQMKAKAQNALDAEFQRRQEKRAKREAERLAALQVISFASARVTETSLIPK